MLAGDDFESSWWHTDPLYPSWPAVSSEFITLCFEDRLCKLPQSMPAHQAVGLPCRLYYQMKRVAHRLANRIAAAICHAPAPSRLTH